ncbi:hypothetical protein [Algoriphagus boritolerans]|uniref:hypothetical protein n=1 Tax=Algoriphagus boritolerans TaxID=308111 RepID=UPI000AF4E984
MEATLENHWETVYQTKDTTKVEAGLKEEGFGILTEIDIQATMKKKAGQRLSALSDIGCLQSGFCGQSAD